MNGYKKEVIDFCKHYVFGKQTKVKFNKKAVHKIIGKLDYIYYDLFDSNRIFSKSGFKYFMTLVDYYSQNI